MCQIVRRVVAAFHRLDFRMSGQVVPSAGFPRPRRPIAAPRGKARRRRTPAQPPTRACGGRAAAGIWDRCVETRAERSGLCGLISLYTAECNFSDVRLPHKPCYTWGSTMSGIHRNRQMYEQKNSFQGHAHRICRGVADPAGGTGCGRTHGFNDYLTIVFTSAPT